MKKERLFYLDFIRAIATISIVLIHFNAIYLYTMPQMPEKAVFGINIFNDYIGNWGVSLFFIISGAALMYVNENKLNLKQFYKKRFLSIFPMFWMAYIFMFITYIFINPVFFDGKPVINILFSIIGFDGYLMTVTPTFYILGEWFLGCIILLYFVFPLMRKLVLEYPILFASFLIILYFLIIFYYNIPFEKAKFFLTRLPEFALGMYFVKYFKNVKFSIFILSISVLVINTIIKPNLDSSLQTTYVGIASFFCLVFISQFIKSKWISKICSFFSKYSYAIFLVHHVVIAQITSRVNLYVISPNKSILLFVICFVATIIISLVLYHSFSFITKSVNNIKRDNLNNQLE